MLCKCNFWDKYLKLLAVIQNSLPVPSAGPRTDVIRYSVNINKYMYTFVN